VDKHWCRFKAAAMAGTIKPNDDTGQNPSYALAAGGAISTASDLATWTRALAGGKVFDARLSASMVRKS
jgi:D-alanyl-D-alanine carboxypeptidase